MNLDQDQKQDASKPDIDYFLMPLKPRQIRNIHSVKTQRNPQTVNIQALNTRSVNYQSANDRAEHETNTHGTSEKPAYDTPPVLKRNRKLPLLAAGLVCTALIFGIILMVRSSGSAANNSISSVPPVSVSGNTDTVSSNDEGSSEKTDTSVLICGDNIDTDTDSLYLKEKEITASDMEIITGKLPNLRSIIIYDSVISCSLSDLSAIKTLDYLNIDNCDVSDLSEISDFIQLQSLRLGDMSLSTSDLAALAKLTQLQELKFFRIEFPDDCSALDNLSNLTSLDISWTALTDTSFLSSFEKLTELHLFMIQNGDITPLKTLKHLETLELYGIECTDYATLSELPALKKLNLSRSNLSDLSLISGLRDLEALDISYTSIHDLSDIGSFPHLTWLSFGKYYALDEDITYSGLEALQSLHYLETLEINGFRSFDPAFLAGISSLKCVNFQDTDFMNEEALSNLTNLETLVIWDSDFSDPSCLTSLSDLHYLSLYGCAISDYSSLAEMTNLGILTIYDDSIAVYSGEPVYQLSEEQSALLVASLKNTYLQLNEIEYHESISWSSDDRLDDPFTGAGNFY